MPHGVTLRSEMSELQTALNNTKRTTIEIAQEIEVTLCTVRKRQNGTACPHPRVVPLILKFLENK